MARKFTGVFFQTTKSIVVCARAAVLLVNAVLSVQTAHGQVATFGTQSISAVQRTTESVLVSKTSPNITDAAARRRPQAVDCSTTRLI